MAALKALTAALVMALAGSARAQDLDDAELVQVDDLRAEVASQIQLYAYDLLDELVYGWTQDPLFSSDTPVILAGVTVPLGLGTGLEALAENHFAGLVLKNRATKMTLVHCPQCSQLVVRSEKDGTVISRGIDSPGVLAQVEGRSMSRYAVFLDFEAEGSALVLRARVTGLSADLPIIYARTLSTSTSTPALLREGDHLKSAAEARREYMSALTESRVWAVPIRIVVRNYASPPEGSSTGASVPPFVWLEAGFETAFTQSRAWNASFTLGLTYIPDAHDGWMAGARVSRLISGRARSLTEPDLYLFIGGAAMSLHGNDVGLFRKNPPALSDIVAKAKDKPRASFGVWSLGLELRVKNRISFSAFVESLPAYNNSESFGNYLDIGITEFHSLGAEVGFCF